MEEYRGSKSHPFHISCGAVTYRKNKRGEIEILLLHRLKTNHWPYDSWHLPKGTKRKGEREKETVKREVLEESGLEVEVLDKIGSLKSTYKIEGATIQKITYYFICKPIKRARKLVSEHDEIKWVSLKKATKLLSGFPIYEKEEEILEKLKQVK